MNFPKLGASQLSLGTQAGAQAVTSEPTDPGVPSRAAGPTRRPGPGRFHAKRPARNGFRCSCPGHEAPCPRPNTGSRPALLTPDQERNGRSGAKMRSAHWNSAAGWGRPQLPTSQSFLRPLPLPTAHEAAAASLRSERRAGEVER